MPPPLLSGTRTFFEIQGLFSRTFSRTFVDFEFQFSFFQGPISRTFSVFKLKFKEFFQGLFLFSRIYFKDFLQSTRAQRVIFFKYIFQVLFARAERDFFFQGPISRTFCSKFQKFKDLFQGLLPIFGRRIFFFKDFFQGLFPF